MPEMTYAEASLLQAQNKRIADLEAEIERLRKVGYEYRDRMRGVIKENERLQEEAASYIDRIAALMDENERLRKDAERWREAQELGLVPFDTIIEAIGDWGGPEHDCFNKAIRLISEAMKGRH